MNQERIRVALSAGHHNETGGNQVEKDLVGPITQALAQQLRQRGADVRVITPGDGLGHFDGELGAVAQTVVDWAAEGWVAQIFLEVHAEDNGRGDAGRGCFTIFPDFDGDSDQVVRKTLGPALAQAISQATGIPVRGTGVLSERKTHVYADLGARLGIFNVTKSLRAKCRRMIVEVGAYSSPTDLRIMRGRNFAAKTGTAMAKVIAEHFGGTPPPATAEPQRYTVIAEKGVNVRQRPSVGAPVLAKVVHGGEVIGTEVQGEAVAGYASKLWVRRSTVGYVKLENLRRG